MKRILVSNQIQIAKLLAFLRARVRNVEFELNGVTLDEVLVRLERWALAHDLLLRVRLFDPDGERLLVFGLGGALVGAGIGFCFAGLPGGLIGCSVGALVGVGVAHLDLEVRTLRDGSSGPALLRLS